MNSHRSTSRAMLTLLGTLALTGGSCVVGCGSSEVGTAPSSKKQVSEYFAKESALTGKTRKGAMGPQSIKKKLFAPDAGTTPAPDAGKTP